MLKKNLLCALSIHAPKLETFGDLYQGHREYRYSCNRTDCEWVSELWTEQQPPPQLPWQMRLLGISTS